MSVYKSTLEIYKQCRFLANKISRNNEEGNFTIAGVPRGGIPVLYAAYSYLDKNRFTIIDDVPAADIVVDDIVDSGNTMNYIRETSANPNQQFYALDIKPDEYIDYPWEVNPKNYAVDQSINDNYVRMFQFYGKDPTDRNVKILASVIKDALESF